MREGERERKGEGVREREDTPLVSTLKHMLSVSQSNFSECHCGDTAPTAVTVFFLFVFFCFFCSVSDQGDHHLRLFGGNVDWEKAPLISRLFSLYQGTVATPGKKNKPQVKRESRALLECGWLSVFHTCECV